MGPGCIQFLGSGAICEAPDSWNPRLRIADDRLIGSLPESPTYLTTLAVRRQCRVWILTTSMSILRRSTRGGGRVLDSGRINLVD